MIEEISAAEASRRFSEVLRHVREGHTYIVTSHGRPVAKIVPLKHDAVMAAAKKHLIEWLQQQPVTTIGPWTRDELYEDEE